MINGERFFHTRDVVKIITRGPPTIVDMIDKVTTPFQLASGRWVPVGLIERSIEGDQSVILNAALFGSSETTSVILLVWLNNDHKGMREDEVLRYASEKHPSIISSVLVADEPWEYRPRAKIRKILQMRFGTQLNERLRGAVPEHVAGDKNLAIDRNGQFARKLRSELLDAMKGKVDDEYAKTFVFDELIGFDGRGGSMTRILLAVSANHTRGCSAFDLTSKIDCSDMTRSHGTIIAMAYLALSSWC